MHGYEVANSIQRVSDDVLQAEEGCCIRPYADADRGLGHDEMGHHDRESSRPLLPVQPAGRKQAEVDVSQFSVLARFLLVSFTPLEGEERIRNSLKSHPRSADQTTGSKAGSVAQVPSSVARLQTLGGKPQAEHTVPTSLTCLAAKPPNPPTTPRRRPRVASLHRSRGSVNRL
jgi:hypothetical protein